MSSSPGDPRGRSSTAKSSPPPPPPPPPPSQPSFQRPLGRPRKPASSAAPGGGLAAPLSKDSLLQKLFLREHFGQVRSRRRPLRHEVTTRLFTTSLPARLAFPLKDVVPFSAIKAGHIFLGFTKCGQFLLSYTQTPADIDLADSGHVEYIQYNYRLHWWLFIPSKKAKKVAEVMLFSNRGAYGNLNISFCQWPNDMTKVVVYGHVAGDHDCAWQDSSSKPCYLTVTAVPSLKACKDCLKVAASYEEDDVAEAWNSCVRLNCLEHGMTLHTTFDLVPPYPLFEPKVNLKRDGYIIVNTGNLFHSLRVQLVTLGADASHDNEYATSAGDLAVSFHSWPPSKASKASKWSELQVGTSEVTLSCGGLGEVFSPPMVSPASMAHYSDSETTDGESDCGFGRQRKRHAYVLNEERLEKVAQFIEQLHPSSPQKGLAMTRRRLLTQQATTIPTANNDASGSGGVGGNSTSSSRKRMAEKAYELTDDDFHDGVKEKLSTFRKKRLAEKTYEFKDEDWENMTPLPRLRSQHEQLMERSEPREVEVGGSPPYVKSPRWTTDAEENTILRPINANQTTSSVSADRSPVQGHCDESQQCPLSPDPELSPKQLFSPPPCSPSPSSGQNYHNKQQQPRFHARFTRCFIEVDDELISVITDIEDDEMGCQTSASGYHTTLPLEVHGSGYQALAMISNSKAAKLTGRCLKVTQRSFDLEVFCHYMAQKLCQAVNMKYWFCNDYDVEIVDLDPESGDVIFVAVVLVQATMFIKKCGQRSYHRPIMGSPQHRPQQHQYQAYEASFKFCWNIDTAECSVIDSEPLKEVGPLQEILQSDIWHPAVAISQALQKSWGVTAASKVKCFTNDPVIKGSSLRAIVDSDHLVAIIHSHQD